MSIGCRALPILIVDDDQDFRLALAESFRDDGHVVFDHASADGLPTQDGTPRVTVLITDYDMPGTDGIALAKRFHAAHPAVPIILVSAYETPSLDAQVRALGFLSFLAKPLRYEDLHDLVHSLVS
jgi:DNA-binding NtrC family response regulator